MENQRNAGLGFLHCCMCITSTLKLCFSFGLDWIHATLALFYFILFFYFKRGAHKCWSIGLPLSHYCKWFFSPDQRRAGVTVTLVFLTFSNWNRNNLSCIRDLDIRYPETASEKLWCKSDWCHIDFGCHLQSSRSFDIFGLSFRVILFFST